MMLTRTLTPLLASLLLCVVACDKEESLGEVAPGTDSGSATDSGPATGGASDSESGVACPADAMLCPDGSAVGRSGPDCAFDPCPEPGETDGIACPADAMMCPDGSSVGRQGPDCEFAPCPLACEVPGEQPVFPASCASDPTPLAPEGCFAPCAPEGEVCPDSGVCVEMQADPCVCAEDEACCDACSGTVTLCMPAGFDIPCAGLVGRTFLSAPDFACGKPAPGPGDPELCPYELVFDFAGNVTATQSDTVSEDAYSCSEGQVTVNGSLIGTYSADIGELVWADVLYLLE